MKQEVYEEDLKETIKNQQRIVKNRNLLYWHKKLLEKHLGPKEASQGKKILEIGSGASPVSFFYPDIITSDILNVGSLDLCFDCMEIDSCVEIEDHSLDIILLCNVLHHLPLPIAFLSKAHKKLKENGEGKIIITEPYSSVLSKIIYFFHREQNNFRVEEASLGEVEGPLSSSNMALPQMIFFKKKEWLAQVTEHYDGSAMELHYYTGLSYFLTGGVSHNFHIPHFLYKLIFFLDQKLAGLFPRIFASFFTVVLKTV